MGGIGAYILGGALQGAGAGMLEQEKARAADRRARALAAAKEGYTLNPGDRRYDGDNRLVAEGAAKEAQEKIITPQPGGGAFAYNPDGTVRTLIEPNPGDKPFGAPVSGGSGIQTREVNGHTFYGVNGRWYNSEEEARGAGGPTQPASGGFRNIPSGNPLDPYP